MSREDAYALVQAAAMETWETGTGFREALRKQAAGQGLTLDEAALDEVTRPERYVERLGPVHVGPGKAGELVPAVFIRQFDEHIEVAVDDLIRPRRSEEGP